MTLISYQDEIIAIADANCFYLAPAIDDLADGDPLKTFVCFLALDARIADAAITARNMTRR